MPPPTALPSADRDEAPPPSRARQRHLSKSWGDRLAEILRQDPDAFGDERIAACQALELVETVRSAAELERRVPGSVVSWPILRERDRAEVMAEAFVREYEGLMEPGQAERFVQAIQRLDVVREDLREFGLYLYGRAVRAIMLANVVPAGTEVLRIRIEGVFEARQPAAQVRRRSLARQLPVSGWARARSGLGTRTSSGQRRTRSASSTSRDDGGGSEPPGDDPPPPAQPQRRGDEQDRGTLGRPRRTGGELVHVSHLLGGAR